MTRNTSDHADDFQDAFIIEAIEANGCLFGGGMSDFTINGVVDLVAFGNAPGNPETRLAKIAIWLDAHPDIESWHAGKIFDLNQDDIEDIED